MATDERLIFVDGCWRRGGGGLADATSPSTGRVFATLSLADRADVDEAVRSAREAASSWAARSAFERSAVLGEVAAIVRHRRQQLAAALTEDQGKPLASEARDEVDELLKYFEMASQDAVRLHGELAPSVSAERRALMMRVPLGVVGVVTPWNWPYTMMAELVAPALAAGNAVMWVPAPTTSACSSLLAAAIVDAGLPRGVFNFLPGAGPWWAPPWSVIPVFGDRRCYPGNAYRQRGDVRARGPGDRSRVGERGSRAH